MSQSTTKSIRSVSEYLLNVLKQMTFRGGPRPESIVFLRKEVEVFGHLMALMEVVLELEKSTEAEKKYKIFLNWLTSVQCTEGMSILLKAFEEKEKSKISLKIKIQEQWKEEIEICCEQVVLSFALLNVECSEAIIHGYKMEEFTFSELLNRMAIRIVLIDVLVTIFTGTRLYIQKELMREELEPVLQKFFVLAKEFHDCMVQIGLDKYKSIIQKISELIILYGYALPKSIENCFQSTEQLQ